MSDSIQPSTWRRRQTLAAFVFSFAFIFSLAFSSGALFSGFQLTEDYQYLDTHERLGRGETPSIVLNRYFHEDSKRIRLVWPLFVLQTKIFGTHIHLIRFLTVSMGALALFFLYLFGRGIRFGFLESILMGLLTVTGPYSYVWWRMQTHENICTLFMAAALWAAAAERKWLFILSLLVMSWHKESYMVIVPALLFLKLWLTKEKFSVSWARAMRRNGVELLVLGLGLGAQMALIVFVTGTLAGGYVGYEGLFWEKLTGAWIKLAQASHVEIWGALFLLALFSTAGIFKNRSIRRQSLAGMFVFFVLLVAPQLVLFQKTGIRGHYVLPGVFGFWFVFFYTYFLIKDSLRPVQKLLLAALVGYLCWAQTAAAFESGVAFKNEGAIVSGLVQSVKNSTRPDDPILMVVDPGRHLEWSWAAKRYLESFARRQNLWLFPIIRPNYSEREKYLTYQSPLSPLRVYQGRTLRNLPNPENLAAIVVFPTSEIWFLSASHAWFNKYAYDRKMIGSFTLYTKKTE